MSDFAADAESRSVNPKMHTLAGFAKVDRCNLLNHTKRKAEALEACNRGLAAGEAFGALLERGYVRERSGPAAALADVNRALQLRPQDTEALALRAWLLAQRRDYAG